MFKRALTPLLIIVVAAGTFYYLWTRPLQRAQSRVAAVMKVIHEEYVDPDRADYDRLATAAIDGIMESLDAHSRYMPEDDFAHFEEITTQAFVGIGVQIERFGERVTVIHTFPGGPAAEAGIVAGDQIVEVRGEDVTESSVMEVSNLLRGRAGEIARLRVYRPTTASELDFELTRRVVNLASIDKVELSEDGIGYLRLTQFGERTAEEFRASLDRLEGDGMEALLIDLRNNPGGLLRVSKEVAEEFFARNELIVYTEGREVFERREYRSETPARLRGYPIAILINEQSASGAEIVAGALQDAGKAYLVGETSYGKGSVQSIYAFRGGAGLRQTTALYYLPSGRSIHENGVEPDEVVELTAEEAFRLALQERHAPIMSPEAFEEHFEFAPAEVDRQLEAARAYLREQIQRTRSKHA
ncbi:MAG: S41 family peptidase [Opitutales bacterium]